MLATNNFLIPNGTFFAELVAFLVVLAFLGRYVLPYVNQQMTQRQQTIREGLEAAEEGRRALADAERQRGILLDQARQEARNVMEQASRLAEQQRDEILARAQDEHDRAVARAEGEIARESERASEELRRHFVELVIATSERVIEADLDPERHRALIDETVSELDASAT